MARIPRDWYPAPADPPQRIPVALWQLAGLFLIFFALLWWLT